LSRCRCFLILIAVFCLKPVCAPAQRASPEKQATVANARTEEIGLLLGIYFPNAASWDNLTSFSASDDTKWVPDISAEPHGHYLTFWISRRGDALKIQAIDGLFVPRATGFWRIGTYIVKSDQDPESNYDEQFWAVSAEQRPNPPGTDAQINGTSVRLITYVGPEYLSYLFHWQGGAGAWEYVYPHVASLDDLTKDRSIERVLGSAKDAEYKRLAKSLDHMNEEPKDGEDREPCNCCSSAENEWGIMHEGDSWKPYARFHYGPSSPCSQGSQDHVLKGILPRNVSSGGKLGRPWEALRAEVEAVSKSAQGSLRHVFVSPKQDLAVAVSTHGLIVLGVENSHINSLLKAQAFDKPCIPVMEQWSLGRFVDTWDAAIQKEPSAEMRHIENP
jgi:hypothetical protein